MFAVNPYDAAVSVAEIVEVKYDFLVIAIPKEKGLKFVEGEERLIVSALERNHWNRSATARELGVSRPRLLRKIEKFGLIAPPEGDGRL